jgi:hypothetical protein
MDADQESATVGTDIMTALKKAGVPQTVKGKIQRAVFRMIVGGMGLEYFQKVRENLDTIEGRSRINMLVAEEIGRQAIADPEFLERAKARFLGEMAVRHENVEAVARIAHAKSEADPEGDKPAPDEQAEPTQDWMNLFIRAAEDASSEELRERLASVLAGEAKRPGTFSRSTVRFIAEADKELLEQLNLALQFRVGDAVIRDANVWDKGEWFQRSVMLEASGLLTGSSGFTHRTIKLNGEGNGFLFGDKLALTVKGDTGVEKQLSILLLTRTGKEVAALLQKSDNIEAFKRAAALIDKTGINQIWLGPYTPVPNNQFSVLQSFVVWDKDHDAEAAKA